MKSMYGNARHGRFFPVHPEKVVSSTGLVPEFKSTLEYRMMLYCDRSEGVRRWAYEPEFAVIPYYDHASKRHRHYHVDFVLWTGDELDEQGLPKRMVWIEIKPFSQTQPPKSPKGRVASESALEAVRTYVTNQCKWKAAKAFCDSHGIEFAVVTERELGLGGHALS